VAGADRRSGDNGGRARSKDAAPGGVDASVADTPVGPVALPKVIGPDALVARDPTPTAGSGAPEARPTKPATGRAASTAPGVPADGTCASNAGAGTPNAGV
jgi:hypothetical protein